MTRLHRTVVCAGTFLAAIALVSCVRTESPERTVFGEAPPEKQESLSMRDAAKTCFAVAEAFEAQGGSNDSQAEVQYRQARSYDPKYPNVAHRLALLYDRNGFDQQALDEFQRALEESPRDGNVINDFGFYYYRRGEFTIAEEHFRRAAIMNPGNKRAWVNLGMAQAQLGNSEESLSSFSQAVNEANAYSNVGVVLAQAGRLEEAKYYLRQALDREPTLPQTKAVMRWLETGGEFPAGASAPPDSTTN